MTRENPERLWCFFVRGSPYAGTSRHSVEASTAFGWGATPVSEYVRADVAAAETAEAVRAAEEAVREGWRACILLAATRAGREASACYAEADDAFEKGDIGERDRLLDEAAEWHVEACCLRAYAEADRG